MASQFFTVKGRRPKYNYVDAINAQTQFLPQRYRVAQETKMQDKEFKANQAYLGKMADLQEDQLDQQKKDARLANIIGVGKLGLNTYFASKAAKEKGGGAVGAVTKKAADVAKETATKGITNPKLREGALKSVGGGAKTNFIGRAVDWLKPNQGAGDLFNSSLADWKPAFGLGNLATGGVGGMLAASLVPNKKKKKWQDALVGGAGGAISSYLGSGGDLFKTITGGLAGGGGGLLSSLF